MRIDPDLAKGADCHQVLPDLNVIARIDVPAGDDAVDLRDDVAKTKVQFSLSEFAFSRFKLGLGLLDGRSLGLEASECAVDVALFFKLLEHLLRALVKGMNDTKLRCTLNQVRLRREDRRKGLIQIGWHLAKIFTLMGLRGQSQ